MVLHTSVATSLTLPVHISIILKKIKIISAGYKGSCDLDQLKIVISAGYKESYLLVLYAWTHGLDIIIVIINKHLDLMTPSVVVGMIIVEVGMVMVVIVSYL